MKLVKAIVRTTSLERIVKSLQGIGIRHMTMYEVKGIGEQVQSFNPYTIHKMIEIIVPDERADEVSAVILENAHAGIPGDGLIGVLPVDFMIKIQTREKVE